MNKFLSKWKSLSKEGKAGIYFGLGSLGLFLLDIISKWVAQNCLTYHESVAVIPNFFYLTLSYNTGAAFSLGSSWGVWGRILGIAISLLMSVAFIWYWIKDNKKCSNFERCCLMLLVAGAVGNLIDRAFYWEGTTGFNGVIDFLQFYLGGGPNAPSNSFNPFATFNVADACLVVGVLLMIVAIVLDAIKNSKHDPNTVDPRLASTNKTDDADEGKGDSLASSDAPSQTAEAEEKPEGKESE